MTKLQVPQPDIARRRETEYLLKALVLCTC